MTPFTFNGDSFILWRPVPALNSFVLMRNAESYIFGFDGDTDDDSLLSIMCSVCYVMIHYGKPRIDAIVDENGIVDTYLAQQLIDLIRTAMELEK